MKTYDYVIVGSGFFGAVFARQVVEAGKTALVIEKRDHLGGTCHTYPFEDTNITVHAYGTHVFHTSDVDTWRYINRFTEFNRYEHRVRTTHRDRVYSMPINLGTINSLFGLNLRPADVEPFLAGKREPIESPGNLEEKAISLVGRELYEAFIKGYTVKQWGCDPRDLPADIITRLPVRTSYRDSYFDDVYQGIPVDGYTPIFSRLLDGIPVELSVDFFDDRQAWTRRGRTLVYTGPIDRFFDHAHGRLSWRSIRLETERLEIPDFQGTSVMNYADTDVPFTRIHEPKHLHPERAFDLRATVVMREYSQICDDEPLYPVNSPADRRLYSRYEALARNEKHVIFGGRLARYRYHDMHQAIESALSAARAALS